ncbi:uncharacterized protein LOC117541575 [Gymnodraco acuticeps]|uniref:Uncharacterized protein LOC117541575 n=1 Tax=Gymnodraco acuticeps TaxID=8218 RepID=A0A6P8TKR8_GYMAC|nr:uncharacterized protein LOC117541575 [Gymnodraco acuticeps]
MNDLIISGLKTKHRSCARAAAASEDTAAGRGGADAPEVDRESLEQQVLCFLDSKGISVDSGDIEACHALRSKNTTAKPALPKKVARSEDTVEEAVEETVEEVEEAVEETGENPLETEKRRGLCGAATYRCSFKKEWSTRWPFITMGTTSSFYWCSVCRQESSCAHQGGRDISRHVEGKGHRAKEQSLNSVSSIAQFYVPETSVGGMSVQEAKTRRAEVKVAVAMVQHNVPFAVADHFSPLYKECFRDSPTAQGFKSASTKTTCLKQWHLILRRNW